MNLTVIQRCVLLHCKSNINSNTCRKITTTLTSCNPMLIKSPSLIKFNLHNSRNNFLHSSRIQYELIKPDVKVIPNQSDNYSALQLKKRPKKRPFPKNEEAGEWKVKALATAEEYNLENLVQGLLQDKLYVPDTICTTTSFGHATVRIAFHLYGLFRFRRVNTILSCAVNLTGRGSFSVNHHFVNIETHNVHIITHTTTKS